MKITVPKIIKLKHERVISMMTAYDYPSSKAISDAEIDLFVDYMRDVHDRKRNNKLGLNEQGVKTAKSFSWANSASKIKEVING